MMIPSIFNDLFGTIHDLLMGLLTTFLPAWLAEIIVLVIGIGFMLTFLALVVMTMVWAERKGIARMQDRVGPNRLGPFGLLQPVADVLKLFSKEQVVPAGADRFAYLLAPLVVLTPSLMIYAVLPWNHDATVTILDVGILYVLALATFPTIGIIMAGWGSDNKYSLLGAMRAAAQLISYEVPEVLSVLPVVLFAGTMSLWGIAAQQADGWFILVPIVGPIAFLLFFISGIAEVNRSPFDLAEAESEIIAGFHTEYGGTRFALFFLAENANSFSVSAIAATLFFGGWNGWFLPGYVWFFVKTYLLFLVMVWARGTLPRLRYDQLMAFAWKVLLPISLVNLLLAAFLKELNIMALAPWPVWLVVNVVLVWLIYQLYNRVYLATQRRTAAPILETARAATQGVRT